MVGDIQILLAYSSPHSSKHRSCQSHISHLKVHRLKEQGNSRVTDRLILQACSSLHSSILHSCPCHTSHQCLHTLMACLRSRVERRCFLLAGMNLPSSTRYCPYQSHISHQRRHRWKDPGYSRLVDTPILLACNNLHSSRCQSCPCHTIPQCWSS